MSGRKGFGGWFGHDHHHHHHHGGPKGLTLKGTKGDDVLIGSARDDKLHGGKGDDELFGLAGRDKLLGDAGNDFLDGGAGSDKAHGGRGDDVLLYSMSGNLGEGFADIGAHDVYDGGKGFDTLRLELSYGEYLLESVLADIDAFEAFLECRANPRGEHGKTFHFQSFDLDARNFEALEIVLLNAAPIARNDAAQTDEDTPLAIAPASLLANDSDTDHLDELAVIDVDALSAFGAVITVGADGNLHYDPSDALELQQLAQGATAVDHFGYTIADLGSEGANATVQVTVTGVNDLPTAVGDVVSLPVSSGGGGEAFFLQITFEGESDPAAVNGFEFAGFSISPERGEDNSYMAYAGTNSDNAGGLPGVDGVVLHIGGGEFSLQSLALASRFASATVTIEGFRDGGAVAGAVTDPILLVNTSYTPVTFGSAWSSIDELRFYSSDLDDYILLDNLQVFLDGGGGGGGGTPQAEPVNIDVLANDTDVDDGDVLALLSFDDTSAMGALISQNPNGTLRYDPGGMDLPVLAPGETVTDTFEYTITDAYGGTSTASVSVELTGADPDLSFAASPGAPDVELL